MRPRRQRISALEVPGEDDAEHGRYFADSGCAEPLQQAGVEMKVSCSDADDDGERRHYRQDEDVGDAERDEDARVADLVGDHEDERINAEHANDDQDQTEWEPGFHGCTSNKK